MKAKFLVVLLPLLLTACGVEFSRDSHEPGYFESGSAKSTPTSKTYIYFDGDSVNTSGSSKQITVKSIEAESEYNSDNKDTLLGILNNDVSYISSVDTVNNVASFKNISNVSGLTDGIKVGFYTTNVDGYLDLTLTSNFKAVQIVAYPRYGLVSAIQGTEESIDENVAINVNDSKYVRLTNATSISALTPTTCSFNLATPINKISIGVHGGRAVIQKIIFYL